MPIKFWIKKFVNIWAIAKSYPMCYINDLTIIINDIGFHKGKKWCSMVLLTTLRFTSLVRCCRFGNTTWPHCWNKFNLLVNHMSLVEIDGHIFSKLKEICFGVWSIYLQGVPRIKLQSIMEIIVDFFSFLTRLLNINC
jgi:hypothetical protein